MQDNLSNVFSAIQSQSLKGDEETRIAEAEQCLTEESIISDDEITEDYGYGEVVSKTVGNLKTSTYKTKQEKATAINELKLKDAVKDHTSQKK